MEVARRGFHLVSLLLVAAVVAAIGMLPTAHPENGASTNQRSTVEGYYLGQGAGIPREILAAGIQLPLYAASYSSVSPSQGEEARCTATARNDWECSTDALGSDKNLCSSMSSHSGWMCTTFSMPGLGTQAVCSAAPNPGDMDTACSLLGGVGGERCSVNTDEANGSGQATCSTYSGTGDDPAFCSVTSGDDAGF